MGALSNGRWEVFAQGLAKGLAVGDAYEQAGYKKSPGAATRLSKNVKVRSRVEELRERGAERAEIDIQRTLAELGKIGFSDLRQAFDGSRLKHPDEWPDELAAAISSVEVVTRSLGEGEVEHIAKLKLWDKNSALDKIAKHLGMFIERHEHSSPDGSMTPRLIVSTMTPREAAEAYEASLGSDG